MGWTVQQKVKAIPLLLQGRTKQVYQELNMDDRMDLDMVTRTLEQAFGDDPSSQLLTFHAINRVQEVGETVNA